MNADEMRAETQNHLDQIESETANGIMKWEEFPTPNPDAMRSFQGKSPTYTVLVAQANVRDVGVVHHGMATVNAQGMAIVIPSDTANRLYHKAAAERN